MPLPDEAVSELLAARNWPAREVETVSLDAARGRVSAEPFVTPYPLPTYGHADVSGYAVRTSDVRNGHELRVFFVGQAERSGKRAVRRGEAVRIAAGAVLPRGTDAVVPFDAAEIRDGRLVVTGPVTSGDHVIAEGSDIDGGRESYGAGRIIGTPELGLLASYRVEAVRVFRQPTVGLLTFGSPDVRDLRARGAPVAPHVSRSVLGAVLDDWGVKVLPLQASCDGPDVLVGSLRLALNHADVVIIAGEFINERRSATAIAVELLAANGVIVEGVRLFPRAEIVLGAVGNRPIIGLPGNALAALQGLFAVGEPIVREVAGGVRKDACCSYQAQRSIRGKRGWESFVPVRAARGMCTPLASGGSSLSTLLQATGFVRIPADAGHYQAGETVRYEPLP